MRLLPSAVAVALLVACTGRSDLVPATVHSPGDDTPSPGDDIQSQGGLLDPSFAENGVAIIPLGNGGDTAYDVALQPDGAIVVVGVVPRVGESDFGVIRLTPDGDLDDSFSDDGIVATDIENLSGDGATAVALQANGAIVVVGESWTTGRSVTATRYLPDGTLDPTFGLAGISRPNLGAETWGLDIALQSDNRAAIVGTIRSGSYFDFLLVRLDAAGSVDPTFTGGNVSFGYDDYGYAVGLQRDGAIVAAGDADADFGVLRLSTTGVLDPTFAGDGSQTTDIAGGVDSAHDLAILPSGHIVVVGKSIVDSEREIAIARYDASGVLDSEFGTGGMVTAGIPGAIDIAEAVAIDDTGRIVVAGYVDDGGDTEVELFRLEPDGTPDASFGSGGIARYDVSAGNDTAHGVAIQPNGAIVVVGEARSASSPDFLVMRVLP